eukprot:CAMPEP_0194424974 /NCGR_PEP_ID=MMETSP0176-20130528/24295_1 /TAXON_ID=216777 /ORGANISM="Proboscia alata, Strain PI-D3" /LENGTH=133 /DNA_ID=CAMNT_0039235075 /DNA_START=123 /DNA_END=524 /DNA_ORIENTATION=-
MIAFNFYKVYGPQLQQKAQDCCDYEARNQLKISRAIVWTSLGVAIAGATYGRVPFPSLVRNSIAGGSFVKLQVEGMNCGGCANKVRNAILESVGNRGKVVVDHKTGTATVTGVAFNKQILKEAVERSGYSAKV